MDLEGLDRRCGIGVKGDLGHRSLKFCLYLTFIASKPKAHNVIVISLETKLFHFHWIFKKNEINQQNEPLTPLYI